MMSWWIKISLWKNKNLHLNMTWTLFLPLVHQWAPHLVEHVSQIIFRVHPGGHCVTKEDEVLNRHRGRGENVLTSSPKTSVGLQPNTNSESHNLMPTVYNASPAPLLLGSHRSSCKSRGRPSLSPRCLWCSAVTCTCSMQILTNQQVLNLTLSLRFNVVCKRTFYESELKKWQQPNCRHLTVLEDIVFFF